MKQTQRGKPGLQLFTPFLRSESEIRTLKPLSSKMDGRGENQMIFRTNQDNKVYLDRRHLETVERINKLRQDQLKALNPNPNLSMNSLKICEKLTGSFEKIDYGILGNKMRELRFNRSGRESLTNLLNIVNKAAQPTIDGKSIVNSMTTSVTIENKSRENVNSPMTRNLKEVKLYGTTEQITPITVKNSSNSSSNNRTHLNQNKRLNELKEIKEYLSSFEEITNKKTIFYA